MKNCITYIAYLLMLTIHLIMAPCIACDHNQMEEPIIDLTQLKDFYILTIPKSGSHLIIKLVVMLTYRYPYGLHDLKPFLPHVSNEQFEQAVLQCKQRNQFAFNHTGAFGELFAYFSAAHPEYVKILMIRDLRDTLISYVYYISSSLEEQFGQLTFDQKLTLVLDKENYSVSKEFEQDIVVALKWLEKSDVLINRFEDLVGPSGGGEEEVQIESIKALAHHLGVSLENQQMSYILSNLFGNTNGPQVSGTFRVGQIGSWKTHFQPHHIELFKKYWGHYQLELGYPLDFDQCNNK